MSAEKKPSHTEAVAARAPCRDEKNVPTRAGSAEPVKMPIMFCKATIIRMGGIACEVLHETYVDKAEINLDSMEHSGKCRHEDSETGNTIMPSAEYLSVGRVSVDVCARQVSRPFPEITQSERGR